MKIWSWLAKTAVSAAIAAVLSLFSAWFVVNMYVEEMLKQFQITNVGKKVQFSDVLARLGQELNIGRRDTGSAGKEQAAAQAAAPLGEGTNAPGSTAPQNGGPASGKPSSTEEKVPEDAVAVTGRLGQSDASGANSRVLVTMEDFAKKKSAMSSEDKMKLFSLLANKVPPDQLQALSAMVEDGITTDEMKQINDVLQKYLSKDEYAQILDIIKKY